ncbi:AGAP009145-PA-like protein [Anopheles sinensis]|uniref:AGAP009145-PA-like protein n=1 Tax=Anopheles sinensis TaxID=74873 RepID=A0A084WC44_ANOSI|nr:AGAP009145-PA-like protein [Anopheles sinensis]
MVAFGIEVYINKPQSEPRVYNYWLNTTVVDPTSKNFTLYEPTAVIRAGDLFDYVIVKQYKRGNTRWYDCNAFRVKGSLIKEIRQGQTESYKPHADDENNKESLKTPQNNTTVNDSALITNTFVLAENADVTTESALREFIITRLTALLPLVDWNNTITEVFRWKSKFSFDVKTPEEKRKILRLLEKNKKAAEVVLNFDNMETLDNNEDYDYDEEE